MYQFFVTLLQPYPLLFVAIAVALVSVWRRPASRKRLALLTFLVLLLTAVHLPIVGDLAVGSLEWSYPPTYERPDDIQAIVVLCGYVRPPDDVWPEPELGVDTLRRCLHAARLYRQGPEGRGQGPEGRGRKSEVGSRKSAGQEESAAEAEERVRPLVIVSGGKVPGTLGPSMAWTMAEFLRTQGVAEEDLVLEDQALSGYENAVYCARLLEQRGITRVLLVTSAVHMPRAAASFRAQGVDVTPAACDHLTRPRWPVLSPQSLWPNAHAAQKFQTAAREWIGLVWYWMRGRWDGPLHLVAYT